MSPRRWITPSAVRKNGKVRRLPAWKSGLSTPVAPPFAPPAPPFATRVESQAPVVVATVPAASSEIAERNRFDGRGDSDMEELLDPPTTPERAACSRAGDFTEATSVTRVEYAQQSTLGRVLRAGFQPEAS